MLEGAIIAGDDATDGAIVDQLLGFPQFGIKAVRHADVKDAARGLSGAQHKTRFLQIHSDRLFDEYMPAARERIRGHLAMQMGWQADTDGVDIAFEQLLVSPVSLDARRQIR